MPYRPVLRLKLITLKQWHKRTTMYKIIVLTYVGRCREVNCISQCALFFPLQKKDALRACTQVKIFFNYFICSHWALCVPSTVFELYESSNVTLVAVTMGEQTHCHEHKNAVT